MSLPRSKCSRYAIHQLNSRSFHFGNHGLAFGLVHGHGLFAQHLHTGLCSRFRASTVHIVGKRYVNGVDLPSARYCRDAACEMLASMVRACSDSGAFKSAACRMYFWAAAVSPELRAISPA
jgi:hypothetical protein